MLSLDDIGALAQPMRHYTQELAVNKGVGVEDDHGITKIRLEDPLK
jgi:hypothetical protein